MTKILMASEAKASFLCATCDNYIFAVILSNTDNANYFAEIFCPSCGEPNHKEAIIEREIIPQEEYNLEFYDEWIITNKEASVVDVKHD